MTSSNGNVFRVTGSLCWEFTGHWRGALMISLICAWTNGWVNNHEAGDLRRHRADNDFIVMNKVVSLAILMCHMFLDRTAFAQSIETITLRVSFGFPHNQPCICDNKITQIILILSSSIIFRHDICWFIACDFFQFGNKYPPVLRYYISDFERRCFHYSCSIIWDLWF